MSQLRFSLHKGVPGPPSPTGRVGQFNRFDGVGDGYSTYGYDVATGSVLAVKDDAVFAGVGHIVADRSFTWDDAGNVLSASARATHPVEQTQTECFAYDGLRQLTRAWTPGVSVGCAAVPSAAGLAGPAPFWVEYAYDDATGNRTSVVARTASGGSTSSTFAYPAAGAARPHAVGMVTGGAGAGSYGYDAAGNQTTRPGQSVTYDEVGKVSKVVAGSEVQRNVFDADGNLLLRTSSTGGSALFLGDTTLTQAAGSTVVCGFRTYTGAEGKPVAQRSAKTGTAGSVLSWLFTTLDGTVDARTNAATGVTVHAYRDPFGNPAGATAQGWADSSGYLGKQVNDATGLTNARARTYDPVLGKFLSVDPVIDTNLPQQNTGYTYAGNNPTTYTDPSGLKFAIANNEPTGAAGKHVKSFFGSPWSFKKQWIYTPKSKTSWFFNDQSINLQRALNGQTTQAPKTPAQQTTADRVPNPYPWGPLITTNPNWKWEPGTGYNFLTTTASVTQWVSVATGSLGVAAASASAIPGAVVVAGPAAIVLGNISTYSGIVSVAADCVAHKFDDVCKGQALTAGMASAIAIAAPGVGGVIGGGIFSVQTGIAWSLITTERPKIEW